MSGIDYQVLGVHEPAVFATNTASVLSPQSGAGPTYTELAAGWAANDRPPARWLNWLFKAAGAFQRAILGGAISDWRERSTDALGADNTGAALVYHHRLNNQPGREALFAFCDSSGTHYYSEDGGLSWTAATGLGAYNFYPNNFSCSAQHVLWGHGIYVSQKSSVSGSWTDVAHSLGSDVSAVMCTHFPSGGSESVTLAGGTNGYVAVDTGAGYNAPTSSPADSGSWDSTGIRSFVYLADDNYLCVTQGGQVWESTDTGDTWALLSTIAGSGNCEFMSRCPHTGAIVATRESATLNPTAYYSHDDGATWSAALFVPSTTLGSSTVFTAFKTVGGGAFIAATATTSDTSPQWWFSTDRGQSWYPMWISGTGTGQAKRCWAMGCTASAAVALWDTASAGDGVIHSAQLDSRGTPST